MSVPHETTAKLSNQYVYNKYGSRDPNRRAIPSNLKVSTSDAKSGIGAIAAYEESRSYTSNDESPLPRRVKVSRVYEDNDYSDNYIHTGKSPIEYIRNIGNPEEGYPRLTKLHELKREQTRKYAVKPYGVRVATNKIVPTLNRWISKYGLKFDIIMIGALVDNQFILPILLNLPIHKLCAKPGFLFIWSTTQKIQELTKLLNTENFNKKFRRSEELIFLPVSRDSSYFPGEDSNPNSAMFTKQQWHCWMCITGTVRRSTDGHLIHCNVDTDLQIETPITTNSVTPESERMMRNAVPDSLYKVAENFCNSNRRLHIVPSKIGYNHPLRLRPGWVIMSPDVLIDNFDPASYEQELYAKSSVKYKQSSGNGGAQYLVPQTDEIEDLRPKSPL